MSASLTPGPGGTGSVPSATEVLDVILNGVLQMSSIHASIKAAPISVKGELNAHKAKLKKALDAYDAAVSNPLTRVEYREANWAYFSAVYPVDTYDWEIRKLQAKFTKGRADMVMIECDIDDLCSGGTRANRVRRQLQYQHALLAHLQAGMIGLCSRLESQREGLRIRRERAVRAAMESYDKMAVSV